MPAGILVCMSEKNFTLEELALLFDRWQVLQDETQRAKDVFLDAVEVAKGAGVSVNSLAKFLGVTTSVISTPLNRRKK